MNKRLLAGVLVAAVAVACVSVGAAQVADKGLTPKFIYGYLHQVLQKCTTIESEVTSSDHGLSAIKSDTSAIMSDISIIKNYAKNYINTLVGDAGTLSGTTDSEGNLQIVKEVTSPRAAIIFATVKINADPSTGTDTVTVEIDIDGDGTADHTETYQDLAAAETATYNIAARGLKITATVSGASANTAVELGKFAYVVVTIPTPTW